MQVNKQGCVNDGQDREEEILCDQMASLKLDRNTSNARMWKMSAEVRASFVSKYSFNENFPSSITFFVGNDRYKLQRREDLKETFSDKEM